MVQPRHRIEGVGDHPHPGLEGSACLAFIGLDQLGQHVSQLCPWALDEGNFCGAALPRLRCAGGERQTGGEPGVQSAVEQ